MIMLLDLVCTAEVVDENCRYDEVFPDYVVLLSVHRGSIFSSFVDCWFRVWPKKITMNQEKKVNSLDIFSVVLNIEYASIFTC